MATTPITTPKPNLLTRTQEALWGLLDPWLFLALSASFLPGTIASSIRQHGLLATLRRGPRDLREAWFGRFWAFAGPNIRIGPAAEKIMALLDGRTEGGRILDTLPTGGVGVGGVVVELGAATGLWVDVFKDDEYLYVADGGEKGEGKEGKGELRRRRRTDTGRTPVTRVYGVEPNEAHHPALRRAVEAAGLQEVYEIVPVGIEDLSSEKKGETAMTRRRKKWDGSIEPGSVDCIVSILCLCSIPDPEHNIRELYRLLRPGGRWYIYEHVRCEYSWYMRVYQRIINLVWPHFIGGCEMCRPTEYTLRDAGHWSKIDVGQPPVEPWYQSLPHVLGVFTK